MQRVKFTGRLQHHFWGKYSCSVALMFADEASARDARVLLCGKWEHANGKPKALVAHLSSADLDALVAQFRSWGVDIFVEFFRDEGRFDEWSFRKASGLR